jgi:uncharacterized membrane protein
MVGEEQVFHYWWSLFLTRSVYADNRGNVSMIRLKFAVAAGIFATLGTATTLLIHPSFVESNVVHVILDGLFVGATVYIGLKFLERTVDSQ